MYIITYYCHITVPQFIKLINGQTLLMVNGYIFHKAVEISGGIRWQCSAKKKKCNAFVVLSEDDKNVINMRLCHNNHEIPNYKSLELGKYIKS